MLRVFCIIAVEDRHLFSYNETSIISAVPLAQIREYLSELGVSNVSESVYEYNGLEIEITPYSDSSLPDLNIPRYTIEVRGERAPAESFLTAFRFRFLSAGG